MIIEKIELKNYRQYDGKVEIKLGSDKEHNVNIILGANGAGKTNIYNAINWCLYDVEPYLKSGSEYDYGMLNLHTFEEMNDGDVKEVYVQIELKTNENEIYTIRRSINFSKHGGSVRVIAYSKDAGGDGSKLVASYFGKGTPTHDPVHPTSMIEKMIPEKIKEYFFFDGEKLENYFKETTKRNIKEAIFDVSQLDILFSMNERLSTVIKEFQDESRHLSPKLDTLAGEINILTENKAEGEKDLSKTLKSKDDLNIKFDHLLQQYKELGGEGVKALLKENEVLEENIKMYTAEHDELIIEKRTSTFSFAYAFLGNEAMYKTLEMFEEARKNKKIPPNIDYDFLKELLDGGVCICGSKLDGKDAISKRKGIKKTMDSISDISKNANFLQKISQETELLIQNLHSAHDRIIEHNSRILKVKKDLDIVKSKVEDNYAKVGETNIEQMDNFDDKLSQLRSQIDSTVIVETQIRNQIEAFEKELVEKNSELKRENERKEKGKYLNKCIEFSEEAKRVVEKVIGKVMDEVRKEISDETEKYFSQLLQGEKSIAIIIDEDYRITAAARGRDKISALSAGERAMLAVSFIAALNKVSGFNAPIVMDTALGRISSGPRSNFAKNIAEYLKDTQIILLLTDTEYTDDVQKNIKKYVFSEHTIKPISDIISTIQVIR